MLPNQIAILKNYLISAQKNIDNAHALLKELAKEYPMESESSVKNGVYQSFETSASEDAAIVEGVFDGQYMIGAEGKKYSVPANYASKSKLVEGDILKLTITDNGQFIYKQIKPVERIRLRGVLKKDGDKNFAVVTDGKEYKVLTASVTYFKGADGDECIILVPDDEISKWAAIENIIHFNHNKQDVELDNEALFKIENDDEDEEDKDEEYEDEDHEQDEDTNINDDIDNGAENQNSIEESEYISPLHKAAIQKFTS